jgi:phosphate-selective porin OprO/OprP
MSSRWNRLALGGALVGLTFCGAGVALNAQVQPGNPPPGYYPPPAPPIPAATLPGPAAPLAPTPPPMPAAPVAPALSPGMPNALPTLPAVPPPPGMTPQPPVANTLSAQPAAGALPVPPAAQPGVLPAVPGLGPVQPGTPPLPMTNLPDVPPQPGTTGGAPPAQTAPTAPAPADPNKPVFDMSWQNGLFFQTANKNFSAHVGATVQYDFAWYSATPILELGRRTDEGTGKFNDGANLRRARIFFEGTLYEAVDYKFELEFMNGIGFSPAGTTNPTVAGSITNSPGPTDAWINIKDVPFFGNIRIGSQKEWFSLEHLNSYRYLEFLERSYLFDFAQATAFNNGFSPGISFFRTWAKDRIFSAVGFYKNESDLIGFGLGDGQYAVTGRLAALPIWMPDRQLFWHIGGAMSHRDPVEDKVQVRIRDNIRNAPFPLLPLVVNTGLLNAGSQDLYNLETAAVWGPFTLQAEYTANVINGASVAATTTAPSGPPLGNLFFQGYYAELMWLLTGESRTWNAKNFYFNRVVPKHPLRLKRNDCSCDGYGFGAWELAVRYSYLDVSNKAIQAGVLNSVTLGLNWYLNTNTKLQFNYDYTQRGDTNNPAQGHIHAFGTRMAVDF